MQHSHHHNQGPDSNLLIHADVIESSCIIESVSIPKAHYLDKVAYWTSIELQATQSAAYAWLLGVCAESSAGCLLTCSMVGGSVDV